MTQQGGAAQPIFFTGLRGMGKTVLLRACAAEAKQRGAIVLSGECGGGTTLSDTLRRSLERARRDLSGTAAKLRDAIERVLEELPAPVYDLPGDAGSVKLKKARRENQSRSIADALAELNEAAWNADRFVAICLDEVQEAEIAEARPLVTYVHESAGTGTPVLLLGAGLPNTPAHLHEIRTYTERWRYFMLDVLTPEQTIEAIAEPAAELGVRYEEKALQMLVSVTAGYPFFIQEYAAAAWYERDGKTITAQHVSKIIPAVERTLESSFYEGRFRTLTPREVRYVLALADLGPGVQTVSDVADALNATTPEVSSIRSQLVRKDVIFSPSPGLIEFRMPLTDRYIKAHRQSLEKRAGVIKR